MAVIRVNKTNDFTVMSNAHFKEKNMSLKAKGLLSLMLSLPDDWDYSVAGLTELSEDGKDSVMKALAELERFGYLKRTRLTDKKGRFAGYDYDVYEQPLNDDMCSEKPYAENPNTDNPNTEKPYAENPSQLNTNISNTKKLNISSKPDDAIDGQLSLTEDNSEPTDNPQSENTRVISVSVKEAAEAIYRQYPRKEGKTEGFERVGQFLKKGRNLAGIGTVRFNHEQLYCAVRDYAMDCSDKGTEKQYIQLFSTFMNKTVIDYVEKSVSGYEKYMERKYGSDWRAIKFVYK